MQPPKMPILLAVLALTAAQPDPANGQPRSTCPPPEWPRPRLETLAADGFALPSEAERQALALALLPCLAAPDPGLRDGVAYEALSSWMRSDGLSIATRRAILERLLPILQAPADPAIPDDGFRRPFAALVLAEVARTDRLEPWLGEDERRGLLTAATAYLSGVRDYRGFDEAEGWRHGVAHGADLLLQLALHPALERPQLDRILDAVASQVAPAGGPFYVYGEPARLARPVLAVAARELHAPTDWSAWFARLAEPGPLPDWRAAFSSQAGLARRHDTRAFLLATYAGVRESADPDLEQRLLPGLRAALAAVP